MVLRDHLDGALAALDAARAGDGAPCDAVAARLGASFSAETDEARGLGITVLAACARHAALRLDVPRIVDLDARIAAIGTSTGPAAAAATLVRAWRALLSGDHATAITLASDATTRASAQRQPDLVVEAASLGALGHLSTGDIELGVRAARRASRMARTEAIPLSEALAHLVLARARRLSGNAHLALRITRSVAAIPVISHHAWLEVEHALAGGTGLSLGAIEGPLHALCGTLHAWCDAAESGDLARFDAATRALRASAGGAPSFVRDDLEALVLACDPRRDPRGTALESFLLGATSEMPASLHGMATMRGRVPESDAAIIYALHLDASPPRRVARLGRALVGEHVTALHQSRMHQGRAETVIATLLLAGPAGLEETECFRSVYGFEFVPEIHRGALDVALHRAREWVGSLASLERSGSRIRLEPRGSMICPDPRSTRSLSDRILAALAEDGGKSAKDVAQAIGAPLRAAQAALAALVDDGACEVRRAGRAVEYHLEDTTFSEPTYVR